MARRLSKCNLTANTADSGATTPLFKMFGTRSWIFDEHSGLNSGASLREHRLQELWRRWCRGISPPDEASAEVPS